MKRKISVILLIIVFFVSSMSFAMAVENDEEAYLHELKKVRRLIVMIDDADLKREYRDKVIEVHDSDDSYAERIKTLQIMEEEILAMINGNQSPQRRQALLRVTERSIMLEDNFGLQRARQVLEALEQRKETIERQRQVGEAEKRQLRERALENRLFVRGEKLTYDVPPVIREGRTLIPVRAITEGLDANVMYNASTKTITITKDETVIVMVLGSDQVFVNGEPTTIDVSAQLISNRTMVPLRFISQILSESVDYDAQTGDIDIALADAEALALLDEDEE